MPFDDNPPPVVYLLLLLSKKKVFRCDGIDTNFFGLEMACPFFIESAKTGKQKKGSDGLVLMSGVRPRSPSRNIFNTFRSAST
jgi:hypothetical protein